MHYPFFRPEARKSRAVFCCNPVAHRGLYNAAWPANSALGWELIRRAGRSDGRPGRGRAQWRPQRRGFVAIIGPIEQGREVIDALVLLGRQPISVASMAEGPRG